jgi:predicted dithiol-disulfide oxidoreductase (DUF899 family)
MPDYTLVGENGPVRLAKVFDGRSQLVVYNHMWSDGAEWQCGGCTGYTSQFTRLEFLDNYDARFVIVTNGPIGEALAYKARVGNKMDWYSATPSRLSTCCLGGARRSGRILPRGGPRGRPTRAGWTPPTSHALYGQ